MITKINVPKTSIAIEIEDKEITIENMIDYDIKMVFRNQDAEPSLDENGDVFEPLYWLDIRAVPNEATEYHSSLGVKRDKRKLAELQAFFEYIELNKQNLFDPLWHERGTGMSSLTLSLDVSTTGTGWAIYDGSILLQSGVSKPKQKSFYERAKAMASELKTTQLRAIRRHDKPFESIVIEQNTVMGPNQQSSIKIGIATGVILGRLLAENIYFVNVSTWRKYWKFSYKDRSKKSMKKQAVDTVSVEFKKQVKDDEADAILIGSYFVNFGKEFGELENHKN